MGCTASVYTVPLWERPDVFLLSSSERDTLFREYETIYTVYRESGIAKVLYFSKMNYFSPPCLCFHCILPVFSPKVKETISPPCTTIDFLPFPQPVQRMSYFKGQDGGRSQVTSFYRSTPQTSALRSRARQKAAFLRSTGKLPHQSSVSPASLLISNCLPAPAPHPHHMMGIHRCLIASRISVAASTEIKEGTDSVDCYWFVEERRFSGHKCLREIAHHPTERRAFKEQLPNLSINFLIEQSLSIFSLSYDVELARVRLIVPTPQIWVKLTSLMIQFKPLSGLRWWFKVWSTG